MLNQESFSKTPEETFALGEHIGLSLSGGEVILLIGGLGAGKTLLTKGILGGLDFDIDEVTSPSFTLVSLYRARFDVFHIDLWRLNDSSDAAEAVGLYEILENNEAVVIIEWAEKLRKKTFEAKTITINIEGDGDQPRTIIVNGINLEAELLE